MGNYYWSKTHQKTASIQPPLCFKADLNVRVPVLSFLTGFCFLLRAALRNLTWTEEAERKTGCKNGQVTRTRKETLIVLTWSWHPLIRRAMSSAPPHGQTTSVLFWNPDIIHARQKDAVCCCFLSADWFYFHTRRLSVIEGKDGRRGSIWVRHEGALNFLLISATLWKGKIRMFKKKNVFALI